MQVPEYQAIMLGTQLRLVLEGEPFKYAVEVLRQDFMNRMAFAPVTDVDSIMKARGLIEALFELEGTMEHLAALAEALIAKANEADDSNE